MRGHNSYAQEHEDSRLWDFVGQDKEKGFYIDVGANDPEFLSVSKSFYDAGWYGINIEPQAKFCHALWEAQPEATTLQCGLSDKPGTEYLWVSKDTHEDGWATFDVEIAKAHKFTTKVECVITTLADVCEKYGVPENYDWLKIDVEGHELQVLQGADWQKWRPDFICIESVHPVTKKDSWYGWSDCVTGHGYKLVDTDRYNRYYQRSEM